MEPPIKLWWALYSERNVIKFISSENKIKNVGDIPLMGEIKACCARISTHIWQNFPAPSDVLIDCGRFLSLSVIFTSISYHFHVIFVPFSYLFPFLFLQFSYHFHAILYHFHSILYHLHAIFMPFPSYFPYN